jgi:hypothetical protein
MSDNNHEVRGMTRTQFLQQMAALGYTFNSTQEVTSLLLGAVVAVATEVQGLKTRIREIEGRTPTGFNLG